LWQLGGTFEMIQVLYQQTPVSINASTLQPPGSRSAKRGWFLCGNCRPMLKARVQAAKRFFRKQA